MTFKSTKKPLKERLVLMSVGAMLTMTLNGCGDALSLEAAREQLNPKIAQHAANLADGSRASALSSGRDLIAVLDCVLNNPECPDKKP